MSSKPERTLREILGPEVADRVAERLERDLENGLAEKMATAIGNILAIRKVIADAPPEQRAELVAFVKARLQEQRDAGRR